MAWHGWSLSSCCTHEQSLFIWNLSLYLLTLTVLWHSRLLKPLKLLAVFFHEWSHACMAWLTCGKVSGIEVSADEGGVTYWSSKNPNCANHFVLPAGYLGSTFWGCYILVSCSDRIALLVCACIILGFLLIALGFALFGSHKSPVLGGLSLGFFLVLGLFTVLAFACDFGLRYELLKLVLLLIGTMNTVFSVFDIYDDTISRSVERSDAYRYAQLCGCCTPRCVGVMWALVSISMAAFSIYLSLLIMAGAPQSISSFSGGEWGVGAIPLGLFVVSVGWHFLGQGKC